MGNGIFANLGKTAPSSGGVYVRPGQHTFKIKALKMISSAQRSGAPMFIAELETIASDVHAIGSTVSWAVNFQHAPAMGNLKAFLMAVLEAVTGESCKESDVDEGIAASMVSAEQPAKDAVVCCEGVNIKTKSKGQDFTKCLWSVPKTK